MGDLFCSSLHMYYDYYQFRDRHNLNDSKLKDIRKYSNKPVDTETSAKETNNQSLNAEGGK